MSRRDLVGWARWHFLRPAAARPGLRAAAYSLAILATSLLVCWHELPAGPASPPVRTAIRVHCGDLATCTFAESLALDVWSDRRGPGAPLDVVVTRAAFARLDAAGIPWRTLVPDIDAVARAEAARLRNPARASSASFRSLMAARPGDWFSEYRDFAAISTHLKILAELAPERVTLQSIGGSIEGRPLWALRIGGGTPGATKMLINGTQHAREWIAAMATTCVADRLVRGYHDDPAIRAFVDSTELWIVPVANPDGYQYSWGSDRYWRKNRRAGHGVDLNRNYAIGYGGSGSSGSKRSQIYRGEYAFSEPETSALRDLVRREQIKLHVDFHSFGQLLLYPWSYTAAPAQDRDRLAAIGDRMATAMFVTHETRYTLKSGVELYRAGGTMTDWMYGEAGALSYTIELRPKNSGGFVLPPEQIRPTCDEALAAVLALRASQP
ncbi:MAG: hypothetical protein M3680_10375 [Myxococcota bacterium]|nr:hypothetical protein [Myxococcota bacterium]